jgi:hypothetical protein
MNEITLVCKSCYHEGRGFIRPVYEEFDDGTAVQRCPVCDTIVMFYSNQGELDLSSLPPVNDNDFEIFPQEPWK